MSQCTISLCWQQSMCCNMRIPSKGARPCRQVRSGGSRTDQKQHSCQPASHPLRAPWHCQQPCQRQRRGWAGLRKQGSRLCQHPWLPPLPEHKDPSGTPNMIHLQLELNLHMQGQSSFQCCHLYPPSDSGMLLQEAYLVTKAAQGVLAEVRRQVLPSLLCVSGQTLGIASSFVSCSARAGQVRRSRVQALAHILCSALGLQSGMLSHVRSHHQAKACLALHTMLGLLCKPLPQHNVTVSSAAQACRPVALVH